MTSREAALQEVFHQAAADTLLDEFLASRGLDNPNGIKQAFASSRVKKSAMAVRAGASTDEQIHARTQGAQAAQDLVIHCNIDGDTEKVDLTAYDEYLSVK